MTLNDSETLLLTGARVMGGAGWNLPEWSDAVAIQKGLIAATGARKELKGRFPSASEMDLGGALLLPGLGDAHIHFATGGRSLAAVDLVGLDRAGMAERLGQAARASQRNDWLLAFNWESWRTPLNSIFLDGIISNRPLVIHSRDLHSICCNSRALAAAGVTALTVAPPAGVIMRDANNTPTGILRDEAVNLVLSLIPQPDAAAIASNILAAQEHLARLGVTAVSEILDEGAESVYRTLDADGRLKLQVDAWRRLDHGGIDSPPPPPGNRLQVNTVKVFLDGSFGSHTAALDTPYLDDPGNTGLLTYQDEDLLEQLETVTRLGWRIAAHAIGDRAVRQAARVIAQLPRVQSGPHRIEHLQLLPPRGGDEIKMSGAVASVQPVHLRDDAPWLAGRIGRERCRRCFIWRSLLQAGIPLALGSDWPVASANPCLNLQAAINRLDAPEANGGDFQAEEALPPHLAVRAATYGWAVAAGLEHQHGAIAPGMTADLTAVGGVSDDLREWSNARVILNICAGRVIYQR